MIIEVDTSFSKDFAKLRDASAKSSIIEVIDNLEIQNDLRTISSIKAIKGFKDYYRLRLGDYRIGFKMKNNTLILLRVRHRKDIYKIFP